MTLRLYTLKLPHWHQYCINSEDAVFNECFWRNEPLTGIICSGYYIRKGFRDFQYGFLVTRLTFVKVT